MKSILFGSLIIVVALAKVGEAEASPLYAAEYGGSAIYQVDPSDGSSASIGSASHNTNGLAYNPLISTMYTIDAGVLYTLDLSDASTSLIGGGNASFFTGLTFNGDYSKLLSANSNGLYSIDPLTGTASLIGPFQNATFFGGIIDLATNSNGVVYGMGLDGDLYTVDDTTGEATFVASTGVANGFTSISFDENDVLYGISTCCDTNIPDDSLVIINALNGATTLVGGDIGSDARGLAFAIPAPSTVPLPATLPLLMSSLGILSIIGWRRRKVAQA